ncbi:hypothetical protein SPBR_00854 [Sporothrix brasiliensis 5110]|uniref:Aminoglycoside phosphotransferase domain-containing protein n=1 Tax=Sporothrix brasiliensis 5110 TaxID=1398154 RepID=A0A0C2IMS3_9PEZI|nr:uncharacterized protein SPBR_00854 [Sporothrix brasiliensis 5110]KIH90341.1 hypothetical protein SPBR_00854 [Sporothrix brasiliensis 5110]
MSREGSVTPTPTTNFEHITLSDIEALEELPGASGRRQCISYRFGSNRVIKVSPHRSIFYEARILAYIRQTIPSIPVPRVYGVRQLRSAAGSHRFCMLMEYIDGIGADEAACEWSTGETQMFVDSVQTLRRALLKITGRCIQAVDFCQISDDTDAKNCDNVIDEAWSARCTFHGAGGDLPTGVQDELFDHIWQPMERGPFATEAHFIASVGVALQRRGTGAARIDLVSRMIDQLSTVSTSSGGTYPLQHANLSLGNFLVRRTGPSGGGTPEIVGVLGWGQCGFYPAWWELAKMAASEERLLVDAAAQDSAFPQYGHHTSVMLHVRDIIY